MPRIRPSVKRMHVDQWKDWQKEAYLGVHTSFDMTPVLDAKGYQYVPPAPIPVYATIRPYSPFDKPAPQVEYWITKEKAKRTLGQRLREWLNK